MQASQKRAAANTLTFTTPEDAGLTVAKAVAAAPTPGWATITLVPTPATNFDSVRGPAGPSRRAEAGVGGHVGP